MVTKAEIEEEYHEEENQRLSLVDNEHGSPIKQNQNENHQRGSGFWKGLFRRKQQNGDGNDEHKEDAALLTSCPNLDFDYHDNGHDQESSPPLLIGSSRPGRGKHQDDSSDDDDDQLSDIRRSYSHHSTEENFQLLSSGDGDSDDDDDENGNNGGAPDLLMMQSEPILHYHHEEKDDEDDDDDDEESDSEEEDDSEDDVNDDEHPKKSAAMQAPRRPKQMRMQRSMSDNAGYRDGGGGEYNDDGGYDDSDVDMNMVVDSKNRKNISGRIQGFGNDASMPDSVTSPRTLRQRFRNFRQGMKRMNIGTEESVQRGSVLERMDSKIMGVVDAILPPPPELEGYFTALPTGPAKKKTAAPKKRAAAVNTNQKGPSFRRQGMGNIDDHDYIIFLECELQNKELELTSWKRRAKELEVNVNRLKGGDNEDENSSVADSSQEGSTNQEDVGESEIEWQTGGVAVEGVLIEVEGADAVKKQEEMAEEEETSFMVLDQPDGPAPEQKTVPPQQEAAGAPSVVKKASETVWMDVSNAKPTIESDDAEPSSSSEGSEDDSDDSSEEEGPKEGVLIELSEVDQPDGPATEQKTSPSQQEAAGAPSVVKKASETVWMDVSNTKPTIESDDAESSSSSSEGLEDDSDDSSEEEGPKEGVLIELSEETNQKTITSAAPVVSDDDDGQRGASNSDTERPKEGLLLDLTAETEYATSNGISQTATEELKEEEIAEESSIDVVISAKISFEEMAAEETTVIKQETSAELPLVEVVGEV